MVYIDNIKESTVSIVSGSSVMGLRVVMTVFPMIVLVIALIIFKMRYNLDDEKLKEITAQIEAKGVTK